LGRAKRNPTNERIDGFRFALPILPFFATSSGELHPKKINTELNKFKVFPGGPSISEQPPTQTRKMPAHVLQVMQGIAAALRHIQNPDSKAEAEGR